MMLPTEILSMVFSHLDNKDELNSRLINKEFLGIIDNRLDGHRDDLREMLRACRMNLVVAPKRWLLVYKYGCAPKQVPIYVCASCGSRVFELGNCKRCLAPSFPWRRALQGPILVISVILFLSHKVKVKI